MEAQNIKNIGNLVHEAVVCLAFINYGDGNARAACKKIGSVGEFYCSGKENCCMLSTPTQF